MKYPGTIGFIAASLLLSGCNSKQVQEYAARLQVLLADYKEGVQARVDAERKLYADLGATFAGEAERDVYESLKVERQRQQRIVTGDLADGRIAPSQVIERLRETALADFERSRSGFEHELSFQQQYQAGLGRVSLDLRKIDALDSALKTVQEKPGLRAALGDVLTFGTSFRNEFGLQSCKDLERNVANRKGALADLNAALAAASAEEKPALQQRIAALTAEQTVVQARLDASDRFQTKDTKAPKTCQ
jgi:hypothetical protein